MNKVKKKSAILITGANGEVGTSLIKKLSDNENLPIITVDIKKIDAMVSKYIYKEYCGSILDLNLINDLSENYRFVEIYHLAAYLSAKSEKDPFEAHNINVNGTINVMNLSVSQFANGENIAKFFFPSSIAVYGGYSKSHIYNEMDDCNPITVYGCNKLYIEKMGSYFDNINSSIDFRAIRFPGLISMESIPSGGTSDYIPLMIHAAISNQDFTCYVSKDSRLPFSAMPDAINAIIKIMDVDKTKLKRNVYNINSFSTSVSEFHEKLIKYFPSIGVNYKIDSKKQNIVNSWPNYINSELANIDWGWAPNINIDNIFDNYIMQYN